MIARENPDVEVLREALHYWVKPDPSTGEREDYIAALDRLAALVAQHRDTQEALEWALDVLEVSLKRIDTIDGAVLDDEHYRIRAAGLAKARAALSAGSAGAWTHGRDRARESSAADVDGASYDAGHHESVGERQGRQPAPDPEREAQIAACPTPAYHETHRYCPSCPWTEKT